VTDGACEVTDDCLSYGDCFSDPCYGCEYFAGPGSGGAYWPSELLGQIYYYASSSLVADYSNGAWYCDFVHGGIIIIDFYGWSGAVRCVR